MKNSIKVQRAIHDLTQEDLKMSRLFNVAVNELFTLEDKD